MKSGGWEEEQWYSAYRMAILTTIMEKPWPDQAQHYLQAYNMRPSRAEPLWQLARIHRQERNEPRIAYLYAKTACEIVYPEGDILFISTDIYKWQALDEFAAAAFYAHDFLRGFNACQSLLGNEDVPASEKERITKNLQVYQEKLQGMQQQQMQHQQAEAQMKEEQKQKLIKQRKSMDAKKNKKRKKNKK